MQQRIPDFTDEQMMQHAVVNELIDLCSAATRRWVQKEVDRDYLFDLTGQAGVCLGFAEEYGLEGHRSTDMRLQHEANALVAKLTEVRELLRYSRYAAASLASNPRLIDTSEMRQKLVRQHEAMEPGFDFPAP